MKHIIAVFSLSLLTGCATIDNVKNLWPRPHDPSLVAGYVNLQQTLNLVDCSNKETINAALEKADWLNKYTFFREDPHRNTTNSIVVNLNKAAASEEVACKRWINLTNINMKTLQKSWGSR